jgi:Uma2 family endonuclease
MEATQTISTALTTAQTNGDRVVLRNVSWELYKELRDDPERDRVRMTYYRGVLELMSPSGPHERMNRTLEDLVQAWCEAHEIRYANFGSTTYREEAAKAGLEPDTCYYIQHEAEMRNNEEVDLTRDPPPDLALEVDFRSSSKGRMPIYAALGVPEVWRLNADSLRMYRLTEAGVYEEIASSLALPGLHPDLLMRFLQRRGEIDTMSLRREFRDAAATESPE